MEKRKWVKKRCIGEQGAFPGVSGPPTSYAWDMSVEYQLGSVQPKVPAQPWCRLRVCGSGTRPRGRRVLPVWGPWPPHKGQMGELGGARHRGSTQAPLWRSTSFILVGLSGPGYAHTPFLQWTAKSVPLLETDTSRPVCGRPTLQCPLHPLEPSGIDLRRPPHPRPVQLQVMFTCSHLSRSRVPATMQVPRAGPQADGGDRLTVSPGRVRQRS